MTEQTRSKEQTRGVRLTESEQNEIALFRFLAQELARRSLLLERIWRRLAEQNRSPLKDASQDWFADPAIGSWESLAVILNDPGKPYREYLLRLYDVYVACDLPMARFIHAGWSHEANMRRFYGPLPTKPKPGAQTNREEND